MEPKSWILFNILVNRYQGENASTFLNQLPDEMREKLKKHPSSHPDPLIALQPAEKKLKSLHHSWLTPLIAASQSDLKPFLIAALPQEQQQGVARALKLPQQPSKLSAPVRHYLLNTLAHKTTPPEMLPSELLPNLPLQQLTTLTKEQLILLIDYLGLRDLAEALRPIVDKRILQTVNHCLNQTELQLLRAYLHQREKVKASKLDLSQWDGKRESLRLMYHKRGVVRLAKVLSTQSEQLIWHVTHLLDEQRASMLNHYLSLSSDPNITNALIAQVLNLVTFIKRPREQ